MYVSYKLNHRYAVTEGINFSDVFSINRNGYSCEYEIKTSKSDLDAELKHVMFSPPDKFDWHRAANKTQKHYYYRFGKGLVEEKKDSWFGGLLPFKYTVPNKYSFVIPDSLYSYLYFKLHDTPYGIITFRADGDWDYWTMEAKKQADFLHKEKATPEIKERMLNRSVNEVLDLRSKLYYHTVVDELPKDSSVSEDTVNTS